MRVNKGSVQEGEATADASSTIKLPNDPQFREVLTVEHVRGFSNPAMRGGSGIQESEGPTTAAGTAERDEVGADTEFEMFVELPRAREVLRAENVEGFEIPAKEKAGRIHNNQLESRNEKEGDSSAHAFATIELPRAPPFLEVLTVEHVEGFRNRAKDASSGVQVKKSAAAAGTTESSGIGADVDLEEFVELPSTGPYREVLMAEHVEGFEVPAKEDVGDNQGNHFGEVEAIAGGNGGDYVQEAGETAGEEFGTITLPQQPPFREEFRAEHIVGFKPRAKEETAA